MNALFPFGFPFPTAFYLTLYVVTLVLHVLCMNYVIAGAGWLAFAGLFPGARRRDASPLSQTIRDWLPFALGAAITAGVAPLLFVQILYQEPFYTANLLLSHRWMAILPVLIVGFYLLYLLKSRIAADWSARSRLLAGLVAFACFAFTGYSWAENHLLSLGGKEVWAPFYESGSLFHFEKGMHGRIGVFLFGSLPTLALLAGWQLRHAGEHGKAEPDAGEVRRVAGIAIVGLVMTGLMALAWRHASGEESRAALTGALAGPWLLAGLAGAALQGLLWAVTWKTGRFRASFLWLATACWIVTVLGMNVVREAVRISHLDLPALYPRHAKVFEVPGFTVFLVFAVVAGAILFVALRAVRRDLRKASG